MRYPPHILEEIRARLPVSAVVGRKVRLKKAGREWKGLSPFNAEKTPSFYVNDQKQFYHCFSSGKHGDIFTFLMETEGLSFPEAVERLAGEAGVALPKLDAGRPGRGDQAQDPLRCDGSWRLPSSRPPSRGGSEQRPATISPAVRSSPETQARFRIGYAPPDRYALRDHLAGKDVPLEMMVEAGLLVTGDDVQVPYDRFRDRVMFPICDLRGRVVAFGGRALSAEVPAKYLNSPDTPLFNKGRLLYNYHLARNPAHERGTVVAVEGYVDVISLSVAGFPNAVAPLGTALTEEQLALLWRMADEPILCFDGDKAGPPGGLPSARHRPSEPRAGQVSPLRASAGGAGPGRPRARGRGGGRRAGAFRRPAPRRSFSGRGRSRRAPSTRRSGGRASSGAFAALFPRSATTP